MRKSLITKKGKMLTCTLARSCLVFKGKFLGNLTRGGSYYAIYTVKNVTMIGRTTLLLRTAAYNFLEYRSCHYRSKHAFITSIYLVISTVALLVSNPLLGEWLRAGSCIRP